MIKKELDGFMTVEYTVLLPILILMYAFLIYIGLFMYNRCILQMNVYLLSTESAESIEENGIQKIEQIIKKKFLPAENAVFEISARKNKIYIKGLWSMKNPFFKAGIGAEHWEMSTYSEVSKISPVNTLRLCKAAKEVLEKAVEEEENADESAARVY